MKSDSELLGGPRRNPPVPSRENARLIRENRALRIIAFVALGLLAPLFTAGYIGGRLTLPSAGSKSSSAPEPALVNPPAPELALPALQKTRKSEESAPGARDVRTGRRQIYLQLFATAKPQTIIDRLRSSGFNAFATEIPERPRLHRVLIGPLPAREVPRTRAELQSKGFPSESVIRYSVNRAD